MPLSCHSCPAGRRATSRPAAAAPPTRCTRAPRCRRGSCRPPPAWRAAPRGSRATSAPWPGPYCGIASSQRATCTSTGSTVTPKTADRSSIAQDTSWSSPAVRATSSPKRPKLSRSSSTSSGRPHLRLDSVIALACNGSPLATSTPDRCGSDVPPGTASATTTDDATGMLRAAAAATAATRRRPRPPAAARARRAPPRRRASVTGGVDAGASRLRPADPGHRGLHHLSATLPHAVRRPAAGIRRRPPGRPGPPDAGGSAARAASVRLAAPPSSAAATPGAAERRPIVAADPA